MGKAELVDNNGGSSIVYDSILVSPEKLKVLGSKLSVKIIKELAEGQGCTMDIARKLGIHEQKVYYHMRKLENVGLIKQVGTEMRYGMTAKIYNVVAPVVATKLFEDGVKLKSSRSVPDAAVMKFFEPFIMDGKLNALIVMGYPYKHGRFDAIANEGAHIFDFSLLLGSMLNSMEFQKYIFDVDTNEEKIKNSNLILFGNVKTNTVIDKLNEYLKIRFGVEDVITSEKTKKQYSDPTVGFIIKCNHPFNEKKKVLVISGIRTRGMRAAAIAITKHINKILPEKGDDVSIIVEGLDKDGDKIIDDIEVLE